MIAVVASRDLRIGFGLSGVKNTYKSVKELQGERIVIIEDKKSEGATVTETGGALVVKISLEKNIEEIPQALIRQIIGANIVIK